MIVDKTSKQSSEINVSVTTTDGSNITQQELQMSNPLVEVYKAVRTILSELKEADGVQDSPSLFKTIKINTGQMNKIKHDKHNYEGEIAFPACLIHFVNVRFLVQTARLYEGKATCRIRVILNTLNVGDDEAELYGFKVLQRINLAIQSNVSKYPALHRRFQLAYLDQIENFTDGVQEYWLDYEVWFVDTSTYIYKDYQSVHITVPPFTDKRDLKLENVKEDGRKSVKVGDISAVIDVVDYKDE